MQAHDDPRLPPVVYSPEQTKAAAKPRKRPARVAGASDELAQLRAQCARQAIQIERQDAYILFLEGQIAVVETIARASADMLEVS